MAEHDYDVEVTLTLLTRVHSSSEDAAKGRAKRRVATAIIGWNESYGVESMGYLLFGPNITDMRIVRRK